MSSSKSQEINKKRPISAPRSSPERGRKSKKQAKDKTVTITLPPKSLTKTRSVSINRPKQSKKTSKKSAQLKTSGKNSKTKVDGKRPLSAPETTSDTKKKTLVLKPGEVLPHRPSLSRAPLPLTNSKILPFLLNKAGKSPVNPLLDPKRVPVLKAAAKLSLRWPAANPLNKDSSPIDLAAALNQKGHPVMLHELRTFLDTAKTPTLRQKEWPFKTDNEWASALNDILGGLKVPKYKHLGPRESNYRPIKTPHWNEVQTNWPGFEHRPLPNWTEYADPAKLSKSKSKTALPKKKKAVSIAATGK